MVVMKKKTVQLQISKHYASQYPVVLDWTEEYCKRNRINIEEKNFPVWGRFGETETGLELTFKSQNQMDYFVRNGNYAFPYFEFL